MSQVDSNLGTLRMLFESDPSSIISTIDMVENRAGSAAGAVEASATRIENAIDKSFTKGQSKTNKYYDNLIARNKTASESISAMLAKSRAEQESINAASIRGATGIDSKLGKVGERIEANTAGVRRFQGAISGTIGVAAGLIAIFALLMSGIKAAREEQERFNKSLGDAKDGASELLQETAFGMREQTELATRLNDSRKSEQAELEKIGDALEENLKKRRAWFGLKQLFTEGDTLGNIKQLNIDAKKASEEIQNDFQSINRLIAKSVEENANKTRMELEGLAAVAAERQRLANIQDPETLESEIHAKRMRDIETEFGAIKDSNAEVFDEVVKQEETRHRSALAKIEERNQAERDSIEKRKRADEEREQKLAASHQKELDRIKAQGEATREENRRTLNEAAANLQSTFGEESTRILQNIVNKVERIGRGVRRNGGV